MSSALKQVIANIEYLSSDEKALIAHHLISSLEVKHDNRVDKAVDKAVDKVWADLAQKRLHELESGLVKGVSWDDIKRNIKL